MAQGTRPNVRRVAAATWVAIVLCGMVGAWTLRSDRDRLGLLERNPQGWAATYERAYGHLAGLPQPRPSRIELELDIFAEERRLSSRGSVVVRNETPVDIPVLHLTAPRRSASVSFRVPGEALATRAHLPLVSYRLRRPLEPGETLLLRFDFDVGLAAKDPERLALHAGDFLPYIGYDPSLELQDARPRRRHGLPTDGSELPGTTPDRLHQLRLTVSTSAHHVATAPGDLTRQWQEDGRAFYMYAAPPGVASARFSVDSAPRRLAQDLSRLSASPLLATPLLPPVPPVP